MSQIVVDRLPMGKYEDKRVATFTMDLFTGKIVKRFYDAQQAVLLKAKKILKI